MRTRYRKALSHPGNRINKRTGDYYGRGINRRKLKMYRKGRDVVKAGWKDRKAGYHRKRYYVNK